MSDVASGFSSDQVQPSTDSLVLAAQLPEREVDDELAGARELAAARDIAGIKLARGRRASAATPRARSRPSRARGQQVHAEAGEDREVQQAGRGHHRRVRRAPSARTRSRATRPIVVTHADDPHPPDEAAVAVVDRCRRAPTTIPVGISQTTTSNGHSTATDRTSSWIGSRPRPGCTRYQWPSSIASVTAPRNTAPTTRRARLERVVAADERGRADQRDHAGDRREQVEPRIELRHARDRGRRRRSGVAGHRRDARARRPRARAARARRRRGARTTQRARRPRPAPSRRADVADGRAGAGVARARDDRPRTAIAPNDAAQQPAVADADLAPAGRDPAEEQAAGGPLQEHASRGRAARA